MRFGLKISDHDLGVKMKKVNGFLDAGHKVKITAFFRGRELAHKDLGFKIAEKVINDFGDSIVVDQAPQLSGKQLSFVVRASPSRVKELKEVPTAASTASSAEAQPEKSAKPGRVTIE
jgi:translation initiation factor IF-3